MSPSRTGRRAAPRAAERGTYISRRMTLNNIENLNGRERIFRFSRGIADEKRRRRRRPFALGNNAALSRPPLMRLRDFKLGTAPRWIQTFLLILIPLLLLCSLSPLFPRQVNNSSSFTYPTPEFIMEIILFVLKSRFSPRQSPSSVDGRNDVGVKKGVRWVRRGRGEKERKKKENSRDGSKREDRKMRGSHRRRVTMEVE